METLRKIELQEPEDLVYLINNVREAATAQLNEAFPPVEGHNGHGDDLRMLIEGEVNEYINRTFHLALPNLTINGLDVPPSQFLPPLYSSSASGPVNNSSGPPKQLNGSLVAQAATEPIVIFEPFDNSKRERVEKLCGEEEDLLKEIAALKRGVPKAVADRFEDSAKKRLKLDDEALTSYISAIIQSATSSTTTAASASNEDAPGASAKVTKAPQAPIQSTVDVKPLPRQDDNEQTFGDAVNGLGRLTKDMPATVAKMERARQAGEYVAMRR